MKKIGIILLLLICSMQILADNITVSSTVYDAKTGEALPYVTIYASENKGAVTNLDGVFEITVDEECSLRLSYVGYETITFKAKNVPSTIRMHELTNVITEVIVMPDESIMKNVEQKLNSDYDKHKGDKGLYFNRTTTVRDGKKDLLETITEANSANNLRNMSIVSGNFWSEQVNGSNKKNASSYKYTNIHALMTLGVLIKEESFWNQFILPFSNRKEGKAYEFIYDVSHETIVDKSIGSIIKLSFKRKEQNESNSKSQNKKIGKILRTYKNHPIMEGIMYIDAKDFTLLRIDAEIKNISFNLGSDNEQYRTQTTLKYHADYKHNEGFTEVDNMSFSVSDKVFKFYSVVTNVEDSKVMEGHPSYTTVPIRNNLLYAIFKAGENDMYRNLRSIIKRTAEEEKFIEMNSD